MPTSITLTGNSGGSAVYNIVAASATTSRTLSLPAADGTLALASSVPSTDYQGIGSYAMLLRAVNNNMITSGLEMGSNLRMNWGANSGTGPLNSIRLRDTASGQAYDGGGSSVPGTWRRMGTAGSLWGTLTIGSGKSITYYNYWAPDLWVRIA